MEILSYIFWPNPPAPAYTDSKVALIIGVCGLMIVSSFLFKRWRNTVQNSMTRKLTKSYGSALLWFGLVGFFMVVCRVEGISYLSMRMWWFVWLLAIAFFVFLQVKMFRARHYEVLPNEQHIEDPKEKYLPKKKKR